MGDEFNPKHGAMLAIPFSFTNITTGASAQDGVLAGTTTVYVPPKAGSVVGISVRASAAITAGTITVKAHKDSTEFTDSGSPAPVLSSSAQESYAVVRPNAVTFAAGEGVGVSVTSTTTLDPTNTLDVDGFLHIILKND